jgi:hypothetical protein
MAKTVILKPFTLFGGPRGGEQVLKMLRLQKPGTDLRRVLIPMFGAGTPLADLPALVENLAEGVSHGLRVVIASDHPVVIYSINNLMLRFRAAMVHGAEVPNPRLDPDKVAVFFCDNKGINPLKISKGFVSETKLLGELDQVWNEQNRWSNIIDGYSR